MHFTSLVLMVASLQAAAQTPVRIPDPIVHRELVEMTAAFRNIRHIEIETTYQASDRRYLAINSMHLYYDRPNRLNLEVVQPSFESPEPNLSKIVCDGKEIFAYQKSRGVYTREKASRDPNQFQMFSASLEMAAMTGLEPFYGLEQTCKSTTLKDGPFLDGVTTNVITFDMSTDKVLGSITLYVGKKDHFLRKLEYESRPIPSVEPQETKSEFLTEPPPPSTPDQKPISFSYDNRIVTDKSFDKAIFEWKAPPGSFQYQEYPSFFNPNLRADKGKSKKTKNGTLPNGMPAMRIFTIEELMKRAKNY